MKNGNLNKRLKATNKDEIPDRPSLAENGETVPTNNNSVAVHLSNDDKLSNLQDLNNFLIRDIATLREERKALLKKEKEAQDALLESERRLNEKIAKKEDELREAIEEKNRFESSVMHFKEQSELARRSFEAEKVELFSKLKEEALIWLNAKFVEVQKQMQERWKEELEKECISERQSQKPLSAKLFELEHMVSEGRQQHSYLSHQFQASQKLLIQEIEELQMETKHMRSLLKIQFEMRKEQIIANAGFYNEIQELRKRLAVMQGFLIQLPDFAQAMNNELSDLRYQVSRLHEGKKFPKEKNNSFVVQVARFAPDSVGKKGIEELESSSANFNTETKSRDIRDLKLCTGQSDEKKKEKKLHHVWSLVASAGVLAAATFAYLKFPKQL